MSQASEGIAKQFSSAIMTNKVWGGIVVNVKSFGAEGDGETDDTKAIQAAIDHSASNGGTVLLPPGTYKTTSPLYIRDGDVHIEGCGPKTSVIKPTMTGTAIYIQGTVGAPNQFNSLRNLMVYAINITNAPIIYMDAAYYVEFSDLNVFANTASINTGSIGIHIKGNNTGYYGNFMRSQFAYCDTGVKLETSSNAHRFMASWIYGCNVGMEIIDSNGIMIQGTTFQDFYLKAIKLTKATGNCFANSVYGCYFEKKESATTTDCAIEIGTNVRTTMLYGNNYTNLRSTYPEVIDNGTFTTRLEFSGTDYRETMKLPNFTTLPFFVEASKPTLFDVYRGSMVVTTTPAAKDTLRAVLNDSSGTPQWVQVPYNMGGVLDLNGITMQNGIIQQFNDGYIQVGTSTTANERNLNYDTGFKMLRYRDNAGWKYMPGVSSGTTASRPTLVLVGLQYFDTTLGKPIWVKSTGPTVWVDSAGTTV